MAADLSHLLNVDTKKHKYEKTVEEQYQGSLLTPQVSRDLKDIGTDVYGTEG